MSLSTVLVLSATNLIILSSDSSGIFLRADYSISWSTFDELFGLSKVVFRIIINQDDEVTTAREALSFIFCSRLSGPLTMASKKTEK